MSPDVPEQDLPESYSERLWPGPLGWFLTVLLGLMLGLVVLPIDVRLAAVVGLVGLVGALVVAVVTTPSVEVADGELRAGSARIPLHLLGPVEALDRDRTREQLGPGLDARAYLLLRAWAGTAVRIEIDDPQDPTPYWVVSTRDPQVLARVLRSYHAAH